MKLINIPNIITSLNLISGCLAIYFGLNGDIDLACIYIIVGSIFDFFDGMTARALGISGPIGKELDSLADVVSFGIAPSVLCFSLLMQTTPLISENAEAIALFAFVMAAFSALRLAKFNCDERQTTSFIGLPTPANALFWIGLSSLSQLPAVTGFMAQNPVLCAVTVFALMCACSYLLICEIPMFSFKFKKGHTGFTENIVRYSFLIIAILCMPLFAYLGEVLASFTAIILLYIIISIVKK